MGRPQMEVAGRQRFILRPGSFSLLQFRDGVELRLSIFPIQLSYCVPIGVVILFLWEPNRKTPDSSDWGKRRGA